ncbi:hypothetical protein [Kitasatospora cheerisanensis]|uniref:Uncharacterized protein n=1 Tax=Kitasatospora cheerisanensis KCTC 2395 TaxID=1348663 RepID=A0A066YZZ4_9ACTN|nr:hypothetical protein [Kitasatospora cheerisanensis]KDN87103.1 hypothetical protein KCH_11880 [Kitasatospora cheerisanensis KCTC 2395]
MGIRGQRTKQATTNKVDQKASENQNKQACGRRELHQALYDKTRPASEPDGDDKSAA